METGKKRIAWMDIAKAIGIIIVLIVHAQLDLGPVTYLGGMFYMPIFFVTAGMTFSCRPEDGFGSFIKKKAKRLLLPYIGYNLFLFLFFFLKNDVLTGQVSQASFFPLLGILYSRNSLFPMDYSSNLYFMQILNAPTWFLTGLFVTLTFYWLIVRTARGDNKKELFLVFVSLLSAMLLHYLCPVLLPWSIDCALYSVAFVWMGERFRKKQTVEYVYKKPILIILLAALFILLSYLNGSVNMSVGEYGRSMILYILVGGMGSLLCLTASVFVEKYLGILGRAAASLGRKTLPVLCLHLFVFSIIGTVFGWIRGFLF